MPIIPAVRSLSLLASAAFLGLLTGCQPSTRYQLALEGDAPSAGLPLALDVENRAGPVVIQMDTTLAAPVVTARPMKVGKQSWAAASYTEEAGRGVLRVLHSPNQAEPNMAGPTLLTIRTPQADAIRVRSADGTVELRGVAPGSIEIENGAFGGPGGSVVVNTLGAVAGPVTITTTAGDIEYRVGPESTGKFEASTSGGGVVTLVGRNAGFAGTSVSMTRITGALNKGENPVMLTTQRGNVRVEVLPADLKPQSR